MNEEKRNKVPVYGFSYLKDGHRERHLVGYVLISSDNIPMLETKVGRKIVLTNLSVLYEQMRRPPML